MPGIRLASRRVLVVCSLGLLVALSTGARGQDSIPAVPPYDKVAKRLERLIDHERTTKGLPAVSIAIVAEGRTVWSRGFGESDPDRKVSATAETVYRVGSVSKLFTDLALMQLAEAGEVDIDAPVSRYLPDFQPTNPSEKPITLRQLMSHRSGLTREPPVGHYFDATSPSLAETVASLNRSVLVYPPETRTKYSNAAIAVVGQVVATLRKAGFEDTIKDTVLKPMGLHSTDFRLSPELAPRLAKAPMWTYDGRTFAAPGFALGTSSAGNLYATVNDLGRFLAVIMNRGQGLDGPIVKPETLLSMQKIQFAGPDARSGYGLGFAVSEFEGRRRIGHGGAVYGFATEVAALPDEGLGVAVVATKDCANAVVKRIADDALRLLLATKRKEPLPDLAITEAVAQDQGRALARAHPDLVFRRNGLYQVPGALTGGSWDEIRSLDGKLVFDGPLRVDLANPLTISSDRPTENVKASPPDPAPSKFDGLIGEYGWDHNVLYLYERDGSLWALIEWFFDYPLGQVDGDRYRFEDSGLYDHEPVVFQRDDHGRATQVTVGDVVFPRRPIAGEDGKTFRITPIRAVAVLREGALAAKPPVETRTFRQSDLVDLTSLDPTIKLDVRYAGENNFLGTPFYTSSRAFMQKPAAEALARAHRSLAKDGLGLLIHDAYRPWHVTKMFWDATPEESRAFVANPAQGSRHNRGCAVDLTLYDLKTGEPIPMVGGYDEFSDRSNPDYPGGTARQRWFRDRLRRAMEDEGFDVFDIEWWHFDYRDWREYPILNATFEGLLPTD